MMWTSMAKTAAATAAFGICHSLLASRAAKRAATRLLGARRRNGWYRVAYNAQSVVTFGLLCAYLRRLPSRPLYEVRGPGRLALHVGQAGGLLLAVAAARQVGVGPITGLSSLNAWRTGGTVPPEPEAQGPALGEDGTLEACGPFRWSRHPLNLAPLPVLWLWPRMTTNRLAFNLAATAYFLIGSWHEEVRLRHAYGETYESYRRSGVPFYFPRRLGETADRDQRAVGSSDVLKTSCSTAASASRR